MRVSFIIAVWYLVALTPGLSAAPPDENAPAAGHVAADAAQAEHAAPGTAATHHAEADKPTLLTYDPGAAIWTIIVFVLLLVLLRATAWRPLLRVLTEREDFISNSIAEARQEREQAEQLRAQRQAQLEAARDEVAAIVAEGRRQAEALRERIQAEARQQSEQIMQAARREIELATGAALKELYDRTAELSVWVAAGVIRKQLTPEDHRELLARSLAELKAVDKMELN